MGWLRASNNNQTPTYTGLQLNTSVNTMPIAIVWGESKIAPNVIWYNNFQTIEGSSSSGGKGGFFSSDSTTPTYSADLIMALCEGPIAGVNQILEGPIGLYARRTRSHPVRGRHAARRLELSRILGAIRGARLPGHRLCLRGELPVGFQRRNIQPQL